MILVSVPAAWAKEPKPAPSSKLRLMIRTRSAVMGVRGLDEEDLQAAQPDYKAVDELEKYAASPEKLDPFGSFGKSHLRPIAGSTPLKLDPAQEADEAKLGRDIAAAVLGAAPLVNSPELQLYVNEVGTWIALRSERPALKWRFGVVASDSVNAFAVPGGYVFITLGLYQRLKTESDLAGVLGHEISHVVSRDHYNLLVLARTMSTATGVAKNLMSKLPAFKQLAGLTLDHAAMVFTHSLDKSAELDADQKGVMLATDAGYEPFGLLRVLQDLSLRPRDDSHAALLFKTHPDPKERVKALEPLEKGRFAAKTTDPDMKDRFEEYDLSAMKLVRRAPAKR